MILTQTNFTLFQLVRQIKYLSSCVLSISDETGATQGVHPVLVPQGIQQPPIQ